MRAQVIIEVDGPAHFSVNSPRTLGRVVARKLMLVGSRPSPCLPIV